jgi:ParB family chromosome partitioning protein
MLAGVLSCRENMSDNGIVARVAGDAVDATSYLPNMATDAFLSCLSKAGIEKAARAEGVRVETRAKDTRARMVERFKMGGYIYPGGLFTLTDDDFAKAKAAEVRRYVPGTGWDAGDDEEQPEDGLTEGDALQPEDA